jgi:hypothetical protein
VLHETSVEGGSRLLGISWDEAHHIMERAVERGLARREPLVPKQLGLDEKSIRKGSRFATIATDIQAGRRGYFPDQREIPDASALRRAPMLEAVLP